MPVEILPSRLDAAKSVFAEIDPCLTPKPDGSVEYTRYDTFQELVPYLEDCFKVDSGISEREKKTLLLNGIMTCKRSGDFNLERLLSIARQEARVLLQRTPTTFFYSTTVSFRRDFFSQQITKIIEGCLVRVVHRVPGHLETGKRLDDGRASPHEPHTYAIIYCRLQELSALRAGQKADRAINQLIGAANFRLNFRGYRWYSGQARPYNEITLGPYAAVHDGEGKIGTDHFWYEPYYKQTPHLVDVNGRQGIVPSFLRDCRKALRENPLRPTVLIALERYNRALSELNPHDSLTKLWSLLEFLVKTPRADSKETIKRASWWFTDRAAVKMRLEAASRIRNEYVHASDHSEFVYDVLNGVRKVVEILVRNMIFNSASISSHDEFVEFSLLPHSKVEIRRRLDLLARADRFLNTPE